MMRNFPIGNAIRMEFDMGTSGSGIWWSWWMLAADTGMVFGCQWADHVWTGSPGLPVSPSVRVSGCEPSKSKWRWRWYLMWMEVGDCYRVKKKIIIFYNMKYKDVLDKKLRVAGENEITWHESRWNVGLLSDSDRCLVRSLWFGGSVRCSCWISRSWSW